MGADRAIHVNIDPKDYETLQPIHVSKFLAKIAQDEKVDIVIVGKQVNNYKIFIVYKNTFMDRYQHVLHCNLSYLINLITGHINLESHISCPLKTPL